MKKIKTLNNNTLDKEIKTHDVISVSVSPLKEYNRPFISIDVKTKENERILRSSLLFTADKKSLSQFIKELKRIKKTL